MQNQPPRTQPLMRLDWHFDEKNQTIADNETDKFEHYMGWLIYIVNHLLHPNGFIMYGKVKWYGEENQDYNEWPKHTKRHFLYAMVAHAAMVNEFAKDGTYSIPDTAEVEI